MSVCVAPKFVSPVAKRVDMSVNAARTSAHATMLNLNEEADQRQGKPSDNG
jgi:hypothetical protein